MMGYGAGAGAWFGLGGWLIMLGCIALVVGLVLVAAWALGRVGERKDVAPTAGAPVAHASDAVEVLRLRFARGEITADEYRAALQTLESGL